MPDETVLIATAVRLARAKVFGTAGAVFVNAALLQVGTIVGDDPKDHWLFHKLLNRLEEHAEKSGLPHVSGTNKAVGEFSERLWRRAESAGRLPEWLDDFKHKGPLTAPEVIRKTRRAWERALKAQRTDTEIERPGERLRVTFEVGHRWGRSTLWISALVERHVQGNWKPLLSTTSATRFETAVTVLPQATDEGILAAFRNLISAARETGDRKTADELERVAAERWGITFKFGFGFVVALVVAATTSGAIYYFVQKQIGGRAAGSTIEVAQARNYLAARLVERRLTLRVTPALYWNGMSVQATGLCDDDGRSFMSVGWSQVHEDPPFVLMRNGRVYLDHVTQQNYRFDDRNVVPGHSYAYALGKRDPRTGAISIGAPLSAEAPPHCRAGNQTPSLAVFPDPPSGTAPVTVAFEAFYRDDEDTRPTYYGWSFGDETSTTTKEPRTTHEFRYGGEYTVSVVAPDGSDRTAVATVPISVVGPPKPAEEFPQNPYDFWHGAYWADATPIVGTMDDDFVIRLKEGRIRRRSFLPISYRWIWGDCLEHALYDARNARPAANMDCASASLDEPLVHRRFREPGQYRMSVELTYATGEVVILSLGSLTVLPSEEWLRAYPQSREFWDAHRRAVNRPRKFF